MSNPDYIECRVTRLAHGRFEIRAHPSQYPKLMEWPEVQRWGEGGDGNPVLAVRAGFVVVIDAELPRPETSHL